MDLTAEDIKKDLGLQRHPTCGYVVETYRSPHEIPTDALSSEYGGSRPFGSALYFLVTPDAQIVLHPIRSDQLYHHYLGDPLEVLMLYPDGAGAVATIGSDLCSVCARNSSYPAGLSTFRNWRQARATHCWRAPSGPGSSRPMSRRATWKLLWRAIPTSGSSSKSSQRQPPFPKDRPLARGPGAEMVAANRLCPDNRCSLRRHRSGLPARDRAVRSSRKLVQTARSEWRPFCREALLPQPGNEYKLLRRGQALATGGAVALGCCPGRFDRTQAADASQEQRATSRQLVQ